MLPCVFWSEKLRLGVVLSLVMCSQLQAGSISGNVSVGIRGLGGVTVRATPGSASAVTDFRGDYTIDLGIDTGVFTVTPSRSGYSFSPTSRTVAILTPRIEETGIDFNATAARYDVRGKVMDGSNGVSGVTVTAGARSAMTDSFGVYTITDLDNGAYQVTPSAGGMNFFPASRAVTISNADVANVNFDRAYSISGRVLTNGVGFSGVPARATNVSTLAAAVDLTDASGTFAISNLLQGTYRVAPAHSQFAFTPVLATVSIGPDVTNLVFNGLRYLRARNVSSRGHSNRVFVVFDRPVTLQPGSGQGYSLDQGASVLGQAYGTNQNEVVLTTSVLVPETAYRLSFPGVQGQDGAPTPNNYFVPFYHGFGRLCMDFNSNTLPTGAVLRGDAQIAGGVLKLTHASSSLGGNFVAPETMHGFPLDRFRVKWRALAGVAQGYSFNWATDLDSFGLFDVEGFGAGLSVSFDTYDNGNNEAPAIDVKWNGVTVAHTLTAAARSDNFVDVLVALDPDGTVDVTYNNVPIYENLQTPAGPLGQARFGWGADNGGFIADHWLDNICINDFTMGPVSLITAPGDMTVQEPERVTLRAQAGGTPPYYYQWFRNGSAIAGATRANYSFNAVAAESGAQFSVTVTNEFGSVSSSNATVTILPPRPGAIGLWGLHMNGSATAVENYLRLTSASYFAAGSAWWPHKLCVQQPFESGFQFRLSQPGGIMDSNNAAPGADGFAFVIHNDSGGLLARGGAGGELGYGSLAKSVAVEFDTWRNSEHADPNGNHISVHTRGLSLNSANEVYSLGSVVNIPELVDGAPHTALIRYDGVGTLRVFLDNLATPVLTVPLDLAAMVGATNGGAYFGFTGATGSAWQQQDILSWYFESSGPSPGLAIQLQHPNAVVSWPSTCVDHVLEEASSLDGNWTATAYTLTAVGGRITATVPIPDGNRFFRLRRVP